MRDTFGAATGNTVNWIGWPWADTAQQLLIRTDGGETLDIAQVDISIYNTVEQAGVLADLNEVLGADYLKANFEEAALAIGNRNGKQTAMPWSMASLTMVYNPQILAAAGWSAPPTTIEDFEKCLADIAAYDPETIPYAVSTKDATAAGDFAPWLWTFGGSMFNADGSVAINSDAGVAAVEWYQKLLAANYIRMDIGRFEARQMFAQGKVAFYDDAVVAKGTAVNNGVDPASVAEVCSAIPRPVLKAGDQPQSTMWGHMLVIFDKSKVKEQAAEFAKHLVSEEVAMNYFNNNGMPPTLKSVVSSPAVQNDAYVKGFLEATKSARLEETATLATGGEIKTIITEELQAALLGSKSAKQAVDDMAARIGSL
ncbi:MAG: sugar ABC transporter substrate-binding protein [Clostridiales bacterium]|jgi:multiple sugar transport system substrate-binding protein|nr:sugar ABC transporter substrate-binding protein [Clostridiales bacterium]